MFWKRGITVVSFLASGSGLNFSFVAKKILSRDINARIGTVITDNGAARVLQRARELGIPAFFIDPGRYSIREQYDEQMMRIFERFKSDMIVAAGYLRLLSPHFVKRYRNRIININPSLLPSFPGLRSQKKALEYGVKVTGCTVHFVDEGLDTGPIIMQSPVVVHEDDTVDLLSVRILKEEYRVLSESVRLFCEGKLSVTDNTVT